ncbi:hypothetical protein FKM82_026745 [Ascaphus truei]
MQRNSSESLSIPWDTVLNIKHKRIKISGSIGSSRTKLPSSHGRNWDTIWSKKRLATTYGTGVTQMHIKSFFHFNTKISAKKKSQRFTKSPLKTTGFSAIGFQW